MPSDIIGKLLSQSKSLPVQNTKENRDTIASIQKKKIVNKHDEKKEKHDQKDKKSSDVFSVLYQTFIPKTPTPELNQKSNTEKNTEHDAVEVHSKQSSTPFIEVAEVNQQKDINFHDKLQSTVPGNHPQQVEHEALKAMLFNNPKVTFEKNNDHLSLTNTKNLANVVNQNDHAKKTIPLPQKIVQENHIHSAVKQNIVKNTVFISSTPIRQVAKLPEHTDKSQCDFIGAQKQYYEEKRAPERSENKETTEVKNAIFKGASIPEKKITNQSVELSVDAMQLSAHGSEKPFFQNSAETFSATVSHVPKIIVQQNSQDKKNIVINLEPKNLGSIRVIIQNNAKSPVISIQVNKNEGYAQIQGQRDNMLKEIHSAIPDAILKVFLNEQDSGVFSESPSTKTARKTILKKEAAKREKN